MISCAVTIERNCMEFDVAICFTAKRSLAQLRQLYFKMKDKVFGTDRLGFAYNTQALELLLKEEFGTTMIMTDIEFPK